MIASPQEAMLVRKQIGKDFLIVTPGVRPDGAEKDDQKRIATPKKAIALGADYIVIGRLVTQAKDPVRVLKEL